MLSRRAFLRTSVATGGVIVLGASRVHALEAGDGPYGALVPDPDGLGLLLPEGFRARVVARYDEPVGASAYRWHLFPDGGACFAVDDGGWIYVSNSEVPNAGEGGAGAIRFDTGGEIVDAYSILSGTTMNCAGGIGIGGTWWSCEETEGGRVFECFPDGSRDARELPFGRFVHEAVCVDEAGGFAYLTEDRPDGRLYRIAIDGDPHDAGPLEGASVDGDGAVSWLEIPDPLAEQATTRTQVPATTAFNGGEGIWFQDGVVWFVTKGDHGVWKLDVAAQRAEQIYRGVDEEIVLGEPDNVTLTSFGDVLVCEDQGEEQQIVMITPDGVLAPILQLTGQAGSELAGAAMNPLEDRLYVSSQRGGSGGGLTYEIAGPFRRAAEEAPTTTTTGTSPTTATTRAIAAERSNEGDDDFPILPVAGAGAAAVAAVALAAYRLRTRRG
jgi:secreted PhoX family phosphatase